MEAKFGIVKLRGKHAQQLADEAERLATTEDGKAIQEDARQAAQEALEDIGLRQNEK